MFSVRNVPVVIEPGVGALESTFYTDDGNHGPREFPVQLQRLELDKNSIEYLPMIPSTKLPHVFGLVTDIKKAESNVLLVYDFLGRLAYIYTRASMKTGWIKSDVAGEHAGKTVTQFSVRFNFNSAAERTKFLKFVDRLTTQVTNGETIDIETATKAASILARSRTAPIILPVAVAKAEMRGIKL
jgi:hypothetical protein